MASRTPYLGLGYFDYRDRLDSSMSVRIESERFNLIDRQIYGLFSIFGDGIVSGMQTVIRTSGVTGSRFIEIQPGVVVIRGRAYITDVPIEIPDSGLSGQYYIYLVDSEINQGERQLGFGFDKSAVSNIGVRLCKVYAPAGNFSNIDNSVKQEISFKNIAQQQIATHRHNGTPSRIDLLREVKNALPGARIQSFDASKISSGVISAGRMPKLSHDKLNNKGVLSHTALESMAMQISNFSRVLMSEVASRNLMQQSILLRRTYPLSRDESVNMVTFVPGVSPSTMLDLDNTTAFFSPESGCISGRPQPAGRVLQIMYRSPQAIQSGAQVENLIFTNNTYVLTSSLSGSNQLQFKDSFENANGIGTPMPGFMADTFIKEENTAVLSDGTNVTDGAFSAKIISGKFEKSVYKRAIAANENWNPFNRLYIDVKSVSGNHPVVYFYFTSEEGGDIVSSEKFILLSEDEVTSGASGGFKTVEIEIENYARSNVKELIFEVDNAAVDFEFFVDNIHTASVQSNNIIFSNFGFVRYRYISSSLVFLNSVYFDYQNPNGTRVQVRWRAGGTLFELETAEFSEPIASGDYIGASCFYVEVEVRLLTNSARNDTPIFSGMELSLNVPGGTPRYEFDTANDWSAGSGVAIDIRTEEGGYITIQDPVETGDLIYGHADRVQQSRLLGSSYVPRRAWIGNKLPISPTAAVSNLSGPAPSMLDQPSRIVRLPNRNVVICDTYNDRVLILDDNENLVKGFGGPYFPNNLQGMIPLGAVFNHVTGILQIVFTFNVPTSVNFDFIIIRIGTALIRLGSRDERVTGGYPDNVLAIRLAPDRKNLIINRDPSEVLKVKLENSMFGSTFGFNKDSPVWRFNHGVDGLTIYVGDFTYVPHIAHPVCAISSNSGDLYVANSGLYFDRIKAGLRDDIDELFVPTEEDQFFYVTINLDDAVAAQNPKIAWSNIDSTAFREKDDPVCGNNLVPFEELVFVDENDETPREIADRLGAGTPITEITGISQTVAQLRIRMPAQLDGYRFFARIKVRVFVGPQCNRVELPSSPFMLEKRLTVQLAANNSQVSSGPSVPSFVKINGTTGEIINSYGNVNTFAFNDFTLGGIALKEEDNRVAIAGSVKLPEDLSDMLPNVDPSTFLGQAAIALYRRAGTVVELSTEDFSVIRKYTSPDGLMASDIENYIGGQYLVAESAVLDAGGRIIAIDSNDNITFTFGAGAFGIMNKVTPTNDNTLILST